MATFRARTALAALLAATAASLAGCTPIISLEAADDANDPLCAEVAVRLPDGIEQLERRETDAQATGAWGDPVAVILRCGVTVPGPSLLPCVEPPETGIQWLRDDTNAPNYLFTTYGRDPAVSVAVDTEIISAGVALYELSDAVARTPTNGRECAALEETITGAEAED